MAVSPGRRLQFYGVQPPGDADMVAMATGKLQGMQAFMSGKMKIKGNMMLAQKFGALAESAKSKL